MDIKKDVVDANRGGLPKRAYFGRLSPIASPISISSCSNKTNMRQINWQAVGGQDPAPNSSR